MLSHSFQYHWVPNYLPVASHMCSVCCMGVIWSDKVNSSCGTDISFATWVSVGKKATPHHLTP